FNGWWDDLGSPQLNDANTKLLEEGLAEANEGRTVAELSQRRDAMLVAIQKALAELESGQRDA
ncbi:MAG: 3-hydroxyacyl-CoA dehydrogenase, partial [Boseongicola sp.]|nr:3-hydroxyacyl-CoA dehydrogenase [Boseongicola sp.]